MITALLIPFVIILIVGAFYPAVFKWLFIFSIVICLLTGSADYDN